jgi:micrococcal nuclease
MSPWHSENWTRCGRLLIAALLVAAARPALAGKPHYELTGKVVKIADGDTLTILDASNTQHKIRLAGIDAPEKGQAVRHQIPRESRGEGVRQRRCGSRSSTSIATSGKCIYLGDRFVNMEMVRDGFAWRYVTYDKPGEFSAAKNDAREHRRGLWADPNPTPPWELRREKRARATPP